jgi:deoxyribose-phosphate aldolase
MLTEQEIFRRVDHTLLQAAASWEEIKTLCDEAVRFRTASVCIPPAYVKPVFDAYGASLVICTVIGFPLGYGISAAKVLETEMAVQSGAAEIDMVINIGNIKSGHFDWVLEEIKLTRKACAGKILKVIIETCYLSEDEKIALCGMVSEAGADFIKTSTGFGSAGATLADIELFKRHIGPGVKIKASGGIKTRADMEAFIAAGAERLGASSAVKILAGDATEGY